MPQRLRAARRGDSGFTLVELQIVLVVLGVLSTAAFAAVRDVDGHGAAAACAAESFNVELASAAYHADNGGFATAIDDPAHSATTLVGAEYLQRAPDSTEYTITYDPADGSANCSLDRP
jgi:prepilin-type N-terminal cleavage/methylation domain-containing protein